MDIKLFLIGFVELILGLIIMVRNKFYKYRPHDILFLNGLNFFIGGLIFFGMGLAILINEIIKAIN
jgi:hypothetical protein